MDIPDMNRFQQAALGLIQPPARTTDIRAAYRAEQAAPAAPLFVSPVPVARHDAAAPLSLPAAALAAPVAVEVPTTPTPEFERQLMPGDGVQALSDEQMEAVAGALKLARRELSVRVMFLTGRAGSGKSTIVNYLLHNHPELFTPCATTGRAAVLVNAMTIDRLFSMRRAPNAQGMTTCETRNTEKLKQNMDAAGPCIIVEEGSMCGQSMGDYIFRVAEDYGKTLLFVGDWGQASPVKDYWLTNSLIMLSNPMKFELTECHRQNDREFLDALEEVRTANISMKTDLLFANRIIPSESQLPKSVVRMVATNKMAQDLNTTKFNNHLAETRYMPFTFGYEVYELVKAAGGKVRSTPTKSSGIWDPEVLHQMAEDCHMIEPIGLALGAQVMIRRNSDVGIMSVEDAAMSPDEFKAKYPHRDRSKMVGSQAYMADMTDLAYANGDTGEITDVFYIDDDKKVARLSEAPDHRRAIRKFGGGLPTAVRVRLDRTGQQVDVAPAAAEIIGDFGKVVGEIVGLPIRLGYAITIHKSQGATLPKAHLNIQSIGYMRPPSNHGLLYVAVSRVRKLDDLYLSGWAKTYAYVDPEAVPFM